MFFLLVSFIVTCCMLLFLHALDVEITNMPRRAVTTFLNVLFLSLLLCIIDGIRRKIMVERPVRRILAATRQLTAGDFAARIEPFPAYNSMAQWNAIIEDFNIMAGELSGMETLRTDFVASVSHELKTPLAVIQNYASMLQMESLPEKERLEYAAVIDKATRRLTELITNILKLNKLENQQIFPALTEYPLGEQLRECLLSFEDVWEAKSLEVEVDIEDMPIRADAELMTLVWNNLLSNAVKFTQPGGKIGLSLAEQDGFAVVKVSDTGCGMTKEVGAHIFEKFYQGDASHATQGNGLGLALVKRVMDIVQGEITVESRVGKGTVFTVKLPRGIS